MRSDISTVGRRRPWARSALGHPVEQLARLPRRGNYSLQTPNLSSPRYVELRTVSCCVGRTGLVLAGAGSAGFNEHHWLQIWRKRFWGLEENDGRRKQAEAGRGRRNRGNADAGRRTRRRCLNALLAAGRRTAGYRHNAGCRYTELLNTDWLPAGCRDEQIPVAISQAGPSLAKA